MTIDRYIAMVRDQLVGLAPNGPETAEEMRGHLEDAACDLQMRGFNPQESEHEALRRFGDSDEIISAFARTHTHYPPSSRQARSLIAAVLITAALAVAGSRAIGAGYAASTAVVSPVHTALGHAERPHLLMAHSISARRHTTTSTLRHSHIERGQ